ncbi:MAG TPA: aminoglycoside phosphotransferase family protein [Actinospica sp.]|jgi:aminoglycoside phosphotransferase (APT) family kinase protein|nr:aminoglycoside phosphotransferase family protein [Actinospica sp.]
MATTSWAEKLLREVFPAAVVTELVTRTGGEMSTVYEVRCEDPAHAVILKVYDHEWAWKPTKERHVYRLLAEHTGLPVPDVLHYAADAAPGGRAVTILSLLEGRPLSEASTDMPPATVVDFYRQMGATLAAIHRIGQSEYGYLTTEVLDPLPDNGTYMRSRFAEKLKEFDDLGGDRQLRDAIARRIERDGGVFDNCKAAVLCHNDMHDGNVLVARRPHGWELTGIIDVENAIAADPLLDLAKADYYSFNRGDAEKAALLEGYGPLPGDCAERLNLYRLYHALELWDWFASIGTTEYLADIAADIARLADLSC